MHAPRFINIWAKWGLIPRLMAAVGFASLAVLVQIADDGDTGDKARQAGTQMARVDGAGVLC